MWSIVGGGIQGMEEQAHTRGRRKRKKGKSVGGLIRDLTAREIY
jgi:hypothetical protein